MLSYSFNISWEWPVLPFPLLCPFSQTEHPVSIPKVLLVEKRPEKQTMNQLTDEATEKSTEQRCS